MKKRHVRTRDTSLTDMVKQAEKLTAQGLKQEAFSLYQKWINFSSSPFKYLACFNLAALYGESNELERAGEFYDKALEINPNFIMARLYKGSLMEKLGKKEEALEQSKLALDSPEICKPENLSLRLQALNNLGRLLGEMMQFKQAIEMLEKSLELAPTQKDVMLNLIFLIQRICKWPIYEPPAGVKIADFMQSTSPLAMLAVSDDPEMQLNSSKAFVEYKFKAPVVEPLAPTGGYGHQKIRIGYLSSNLSMHAVSLLTIELFERHDRTRFEVFGFCWSHEDGTDFRQRVVKSFDHFFRIGNMSDKEAAACIRAHEIDVLVDLHGLTGGARPLILSYRPAPVQATYLGFPGSSGLPWVDYIIADQYLIPEKEARFYSEKPLYMPKCFQSSDSKRLFGAFPDKASHNLPDDKFIFCSFNNNYKYNPEMFSAWMRILKRVPHSILWLLADNEWAKENLLKFASQNDINPDRLIFAGRALPEDYLARYQLADLFLDTYPFNGGTTANDSLFMGLPILTLSGRTFAARMAGSLLMNLGLPELVTTSLQEYEDKAVDLAGKGPELAEIRNRLASARNSSGVFDMQDFVAGYEQAISQLLLNRKLIFEANTVASQTNRFASAKTNSKALLVQGWRGINHSIAMVNQYQLLALAKEAAPVIYHQDVSFASHGWSKEKNASGFSAADESRIKSYAGEQISSVYRIFTPCEIAQTEVKTITFMVTELGLDLKNFSSAPQIQAYEKSGNYIVTPSNWSRERIIDYGFSENHVFVIPHGVDTARFYPFAKETRKSTREKLGYNDDDVVFLNVGAPIWSKGMDLLLRAFFAVHSSKSNAKLLIYDEQTLYGVSAQTMISELASSGQVSISDKNLGAIRVIPATLTIEQLNSLYNIADYYLSPYRAEGFNLPAIESIACGTPAIVTAGGSTDDFCDNFTTIKIPSRKQTNVVIGGRSISAYLEPDYESLVSIMKQCASQKALDPVGFSFGRCNMLQQFTWERAAKLICALV